MPAHKALAVACLAGTLAFWAYTQTLLPGVDLGDTGGFQAAVAWPEVSARQAYPLYYALARPFVAGVSPSNPARGLNLFSAIWGGAAVALLTFFCASVTRSLLGGAVAGLLLAFSYTFWTQAIIAEVYTLHLALVALCLIGLQAYATRPTRVRLGIFFAAYAMSFGNHLLMVLLLAPFTVFLFLATPNRRDLLHPRVLGMATAIALLGAALYWPSVEATSNAVYPPASWFDRAAAFWFDVTKSDWRDTMVLGVAPDQAGDRLGMWWFDLRQQFGAAGVALACVGAAALWKTSRPWAVLVAIAYAIATVFALTYNVGDAHVFFLTSNFLLALCAGAAVSSLSGGEPFRVRPASLTRLAPRDLTRLAPLVFGCLALLYCGWRGWTTWPAVDRHEDRRGERLIASLALGMTDRNAVLVERMDWQLENVLLYLARYDRRDLAWTRLGDVLPHFPRLVADNHAIARDVVLSAEAASDVVAAYGPAFPIVEDGGAVAFTDALARMPQGSPYVFALLTPLRSEPLDPDALASILGVLSGGNLPERRAGAYQVIAGISGEPPLVYRSSDRPFTDRFSIAGESFQVRMDAWLPADTFRRAGFGHVLRGREHALIIERGGSLVWIGRDGVASSPHYVAGLYAPKPRFRIPAAAPQLAGTSLPVGAKLVGHRLIE